VEQEELGIAGGLQDRVCQTYEKLLYMDFRRDLLEGRGYGDYQELDPALLPPLYIAYDTQLGHAAKFHNNVRERWKQGDPEVVAAMQEFAGFAERGRQALLDRDYPELERLINANFDLRRRIYPLDPRHIRMVEIARELGAAAKFAGSGGSVIGTYRGEAMFQALQRAFQNFGCQVIKPA
jgi:glucuronokinase